MCSAPDLYPDKKCKSLNGFGPTDRAQGCQMDCVQTKNPNLGKFWRVLQMQYDGIFYKHLDHFTVFCYILWTFGIGRGYLVYFFLFWYFVRRKIWQP
jgi:hypothetical protein